MKTEELVGRARVEKRIVDFGTTTQDGRETVKGETRRSRVRQGGVCRRQLPLARKKKQPSASSLSKMEKGFGRKTGEERGGLDGKEKIKGRAEL